MRMTLVLPEQLINDALEISYIKTKTGVIIAALEDYVRKARIRELHNFKGKVDLDIDLNILRERSSHGTY